MKVSSVVIVILTRSFVGEVCEALNVTVSPGPVITCPDGGNVTLSCRVSQRKWAASLLVVRWLFAGQQGAPEQLIVKLNMRKTQYYGNYTRRFAQPKLRLSEEDEGKAYNLLVLHVSQEDTGRYVCRVQEIRKHRNRWRASSNGTDATELRVHAPQAADNREGIWRLFEDVYLCAVLLCSIGLVCMVLFLVITSCQHVQRKRRLKANYNLVKSLQNSSGETVTSVIGSSPGLPRKQTSKDPPSETPPDIPAKAPMGDNGRRPKLLKIQPRKVALVTEESLTYAELELVKPQADAKAACTGTVYAQILFEEKQK
ncbi:V-set and transmembrane domain-containing protein 4a [Conger conger]|uniref:V-set and transmembrane domain-containing protein 4a n=1 Tax=Conger conger TaxID=82655 RepID=UPI002A598773|nr:V-set and transmembrane domain-containing protein 4a [Conger conger]